MHRRGFLRGLAIAALVPTVPLIGKIIAPDTDPEWAVHVRVDKTWRRVKQVSFDLVPADVRAAPPFLLPQRLHAIHSAVGTWDRVRVFRFGVLMFDDIIQGAPLTLHPGQTAHLQLSLTLNRGARGFKGR
jgi:hypothetical protein